MRSMRAYRANVTQRIFLSEITLPDAAAAFSRVTHDTPPPPPQWTETHKKKREMCGSFPFSSTPSAYVCILPKTLNLHSSHCLSTIGNPSIYASMIMIPPPQAPLSIPHPPRSLSFVPRSWPTSSSSMADNLALELDAGIRVWVLLPITVAMFLVGVLRHLASKLLTSKPAPPRGETQLAQLKEAQAVMRAQVRPGLSLNVSLSLSLCVCVCVCV